ncbi:O(6)-methylguanine-induced apoptosis 2 isoform X2 [Xyrichtys novacula]|uniref:O(6)-methylguanine-induced apoptosis 2 isoform X2 n=1 Tax=Xyrichtys novacula TaxID=13765 RepID=A0AAV1HC15_XYRNO|nr:O(6)-methylguanine-induced apoptosis 2 isoform X2 [Xyrichtys novacula]
MGDVYRGNENETPTHSVPSIPSKHQRVVIVNQERKKGFLTQAKRFPSQDSLRENPGPASYDCVFNAEIQSPSFSKKGTTGFVVSKTARPSSYLQRGIPGPNAYNLQSSLIDKYDFNLGVSRVFRLPVAVKVENTKNLTPAPNQYDVSYRSRERSSSVVGTSTFLSKTRRGICTANKDAPSPCQYDVSIQTCSKVISSPFRSKTQRIPAPVEKCTPGPGAYSPHQAPTPVKKTFIPRGQYSTKAGPALIVPKDPPIPGPGHYDINDYRGLSKHPMPSAAFASKTERTFQNLKATVNPGPGFYDPQILSKQSFIYSDPKVWIPV